MYTYYDIPKAIDVSHYSEQTKMVILRLRESVPDIVSIYTMWEQDLCGLSDIDLLCIVHKNTPEKMRIIENISKEFSLLDVPHCIDEESVLLLSYFIQRPYLKWAWWREFDIPETHPEAKIFFAWKLCFIGLLRIFYPAVYSKKISVELILKQIYYIRYLITFLEINDSEITDFLSEYSQFRKTWFTHQDCELLAQKYLPKAIDVSWGIIKILDAKLSLLTQPNHNKKSDIFIWRYPTFFSDSDFRIKTEKYFKKVNKNDRFLCLPYSFNMSNWNKSQREVLDKITVVSPQFLDFWFGPISLRFLLWVKKIKDFFSITYYKYRILWKR